MTADRERPMREAAIERLTPACDFIPHAYVHHERYPRWQVDVLCRPRDARYSDISFAIEIKSDLVVGDELVARWIKQSADYVGLAPENGWPRIHATFLWMVGVTFKAGEEPAINVMLQLAQHFRVGHAREIPGRNALTLMFGASHWVYQEPKVGDPSNGWMRHAHLLTAKRREGGQDRYPWWMSPRAGRCP